MDQVLPAMESIQKNRDLLQENCALLQENRDLLQKNCALLQRNRDLLRENRDLLQENHALLLENRAMLLAIIEHLGVPYWPKPIVFNRGVPPKRPAPRSLSAVRESRLP